jgi:hypothetical protein
MRLLGGHVGDHEAASTMFAAHIHEKLQLIRTIQSAPMSLQSKFACLRSLDWAAAKVPRLTAFLRRAAAVPTKSRQQQQHSPPHKQASSETTPYQLLATGCCAPGPEGVDVDDAPFELGVESSQYHCSSGAEALCDAGGEDVHESYAHVQDFEGLFFASARQAVAEASRQLRLEDARSVALPQGDGLHDEGLRSPPSCRPCLYHEIRGERWTNPWPIGRQRDLI